MSNLRRFHKEGNIYFVTCVTYKRLPILINNCDLFQRSLASCNNKSTFVVFAHALLPDHFHLLIDPKEEHISRILQKLKMSFGMHYRKKAGLTSGRVWQHRFWDHIIRNQQDMNRHIDYIHYNPVRHGLVRSPFDWGNSSIHEYLAEGYYEAHWGVKDTIEFDGDFGE